MKCVRFLEQFTEVLIFHLKYLITHDFVRRDRVILMRLAKFYSTRNNSINILYVFAHLKIPSGCF